MKRFGVLSAAVFFILATTLSQVDARGHSGSHRFGGHNSHGKGSHYYGGHKK